MIDRKTNIEIQVHQLRLPPEPAHGAWQIYGNVQLALAALIEQNEKIIELLSPSDPKKP